LYKVVDTTLDTYSRYLNRKIFTETVEYKGEVAKLLDSFPEFPGKNYLYKSISWVRKNSDAKFKKIVSLNKVPKKALIFAGVTIGLFSVVYGVLKVRKMIRGRGNSK